MKTPVNTFKQAMAHGRPQIGLWLALANPYTAEILGSAGYDWLLLDGEHAPNDVPSLLGQLQAISSASHTLLADPQAPYAPSHPIARLTVGTGDAGVALVKQYLDIGVQTLLVPMIDTPEQAEQVVRAAKYPPQGIRGMGSPIARASRWQAYPDYIQEANEQVCVLLQAETVEAMKNLDAIAATPGVDGVFIGPADLSASMGYPGNPGHPEVQAVIEAGIARILQAGKAPGILATTPDQARKWLDAGALFVAVGVDSILLTSAASALLEQYKPRQGQATPHGY